MPMSIDFPTKVISVPQSDLTPVSGTVYTMDTEGYFRTQLMALMDNALAMSYPQAYFHETESTIAGIIYARKIKIINGYSVTFTPDAQWTVILQGSNNDIFDVITGVLNQNQVQVIPTNAAGLQTVETGVSGLTPSESAKLDGIDSTLISLRKLMQNRMETNPLTGVLTIYDDDDVTPLLTGNIYEDVLAAQIYRGRGVERRDRLT